MVEIEHSSKIGMLLYAVLKHKLPEKLEESPKTLQELCEGTSLIPLKLERCLLALESISIFKFDSLSSRWSNSDNSRALIPKSKTLIYSFNALNLNSYTKVVDGMFHPGTATELFYGKSNFLVFGENPELLAEFQDCMDEGTATESDDTAEYIDLNGMNSALDIGGGRGTLAVELAKKHPHVKIGVFEKHEVVPMIQQLASQESVDIEAIGGSFLDSVPSNYSCLIMKYILHDWNDYHCVQILKNCRTALEKGSFLFVVDCIIDKASVSYVNQRRIDMIMMNTVGGKERTLAQFNELFVQADFEVQSVHTGELLSVIKAVAI